MPLSPDFPKVDEFRSLVREIAREELCPRFALAARDYKEDGSIVTAADLAMQRRLGRALTERWPQIGVLSEEMTRDEQQSQLDSGRPLWVLDPLDGTTNFASGIPFFAVSLALMYQGTVFRALVHDPMRDESFSATLGGGVLRNGRPLIPAAIPPMHKAIALVDYKRLPAELAHRLATHPPYGSQRSFGSVALELCWLAAGRGQLYLHGRQQLWDYAAAMLILEEAGGQAATLEGEPVMRPCLESRSAIAALDKDLFSEWAAWVGAADVAPPRSRETP